MIERITEYLMNWCIRKNRILKITGTGGPEDVYLIRYYVFRSRFFNIFIHQFLRSDRDDLHDHPWDFVTYLVRGSYTEKKWDDKTQSITETFRLNWFPSYLKNRIKLNTLVFRHAEDQHMVMVDQDLKEKDKAQAPLTICVTGRTRREWGFIKDELIKVGEFSYAKVTVNGVNIEGLFKPGESGTIYRHGGRHWIDWRTYLGLPPDTKGRG